MAASRTDGRVFGGIVMHETQLQMLGDDVQPVRQKMRPDPLRHLHAAEIGKLRIGLSIMIEARPPDAEIERRIVRDHRRITKVVMELVHHLGKFRRILDMFGRMP